MIVTKEIKMSSKKVLSFLFLEYGIFWIGAAAVGAFIFIILGFAVDYRFFILTLIWIFLLVPLVVAFLYFFYGMEPLTSFNAMPHVINFYGPELGVKVIHENSNTEESSETNMSTVVSKEYKVALADFKKMKTGGDYVILFFKKAGWIWVPVYAFDTVTNFQNALSFFYGGNKHE